MHLRNFTSNILILLQTLVVWIGTGHLHGQILRLEIEPEWQGQSLKQHSQQSSIQIERLDFLLSDLALKRADQTWLESADWSAFLSLEKNRTQAEADQTPREKFTAIRFKVGVPPQVNAADPAQWPAGHALNPAVNGLHWGWQGGFVFLALEGRWTDQAGQSQGFSYHLGNDTNLATVELPVEFQGGGPLTVQIRLAAEQLLEGISFQEDGNSTHSRAGDSLADKLRRNVERAFQVKAVKHDLYQRPLAAAAAAPSLPSDSQAYALAITQRFPQVNLPSDNPLTVAGVALGERLFHDPRLSINNRQSCADCHRREAAFAEPTAVSTGAENQKGQRNAMPLFNLAWAETYFWDGRAKSLREQVLMPIQDAHEMNETLDRVVTKLADLSDDFQQAFGSPQIRADNLAKALEQYLLTLISQESRFDKAVRKVAELTEEEKRGLQLFVTEHDPKRGLFGADCFHCHGGTLFTDHQFKNNGLKLAEHDLGRWQITGAAQDRGKFKTPSLRNIAVTAPYMHDGRFQTLEQVVEHYSSGVQRTDTLDPNLAKHPVAGLQLSRADQHALVAFLKTLTDDEFIASPSPRSLAKQP